MIRENNFETRLLEQLCTVCNLQKRGRGIARVLGQTLFTLVVVFAMAELGL